MKAIVDSQIGPSTPLDPQYDCKPMGVPRASMNAIQIVQAPKLVSSSTSRISSARRFALFTPTVAQQVRRWIAEPLSVDMWMGLPGELTSRVVPRRWDEADLAGPRTRPNRITTPGRTPLTACAVAENPVTELEFTNEVEVREHYSAERPAMGAITDARALATMYAALLGPVDGVRLVEPHTLVVRARPRTDGVETLVESGTTGPTSASVWATSSPRPACPASGRTRSGTPVPVAAWALPIPSTESGSATSAAGCGTSAPGGDPRLQTLIGAVRACL